MAYRKGDLQIVTEDSLRDEFGLGPDEGAADYAPSDSRDDFITANLPIVLLPHSCSEWIIGGIGEVRQLLLDLTEILHKLDAEKVK